VGSLTILGERKAGLEPVLSIFEDCHGHLGDGATTGHRRTHARVEIGCVNQTEKVQKLKLLK